MRKNKNKNLPSDETKRVPSVPPAGGLAEAVQKSEEKTDIDAQADKAAMEALFGPVQVVDADLAGEFGFVTVSLSEAEYAERAAKSDKILNRIRVEG